MAGKKGNDYFKMFVKLTDYACSAAQMLHDALLHFDAEQLPRRMEEMHKIEHSADVEKHDMMNRLVREFITPIEREDIIDLAQEIDDLTDSIEDVLMRMYMYNIRDARDEALEFSTVITGCCAGLRHMMEEFRNFRKSATIHDQIVEINRLEEEGDKIYTRAVRRLYVECEDAIHVMSWADTFDKLEKCCDACEHVANMVESIVMKYS